MHGFPSHLIRVRLRLYLNSETPPNWAARSRNVPRRGLEPPSLAALYPEPSVFANFTTWARGALVAILYRLWYTKSTAKGRSIRAQELLVDPDDHAQCG